MAQKRKPGTAGSSDNRYTKPNEVHDKLESLGKNYNQLYDAILRNAILRWDLDADDVWAQARFRADKAQMMRWAGLSKHTFYDKWGRITEAGLIREEPDGVFVVMKLIRKEDLGIVPSEFKRMQQENADMREEIAELREQVGEIEELREELRALMVIVQGVPKNGQDAPENSSNEVQKSDRSVQKSDRSVQKLHPPHPFKGLKNKKNSLSRETIISGFYRGIGQTRISGREREKARVAYKELREDEFSLEDVAFAVQWTIENAKEKPRTFGLINSTIGQAMDAKAETEANAKRLEEERRLVDEARADRENQAEDRERIEALKEKMSTQKRENLREEALLELRGTPGISPALIGEALIEAKENEIIRRLTAGEAESREEAGEADI